MSRKLYLVAYDVCEPKRLKRMLNVLKEFASGGQKSAFECYLSDAEKRRLLMRVENVMEPQEDAFMIIKLAERAAVNTLGIAVAPLDQLYTYLG